VANFELLLPVGRPLRDVVVTDPAAPLPPVGPSPEELARAEKQRREEQEALRRVLGRLEEVAAELLAQQRQRLQEMQTVAVELAAAVASRLVHERIEAGDFAVETLVRRAVEKLQTTQPVTVTLHPQDLELLEKRLGGQPAGDIARLRLVGNATLGRGDCRAEAGDEGVQAVLAEQIAEMRRHLLEALPDAAVDRRRPPSPERPLKRFPDRRHTA
jgi:flagellar biosynthesis/type III secretory pathway protein FliH